MQVAKDMLTLNSWIDNPGAILLPYRPERSYEVENSIVIMYQYDEIPEDETGEVWRLGGDDRQHREHYYWRYLDDHVRNMDARDQLANGFARYEPRPPDLPRPSQGRGLIGNATVADLPDPSKGNMYR